jgi:hypothetical protein
MKQWSRKRRLFLIEFLLFDALVITGAVLALTGTGFDRALALATGLVAVILCHLVLRVTYFKRVPAEIRKERREHRDENENEGPRF